VAQYTFLFQIPLNWNHALFALSLSLAACFGWGVADFLGGLKSRQLSVFTVLMLSSFFGLGAILIIVWIRGVAPPNDPALWLAVVGGVAGVVAMFCLYRGLSIGSMAIVAPISATGVILPVIVSLAAGDNPTLLQKSGMAIAIIGAVLASREKNDDGNGSRAATGMGLAVGSAIAAGIFFVVMDQASEADPYWAAFLMRFSYFVFLIAIFLLKRPAVQAGKMHMPAIIVLGICDALAGFAYALATTRGMLGLVAVVGALYPAVTVLLSMLILNERPQLSQFIGVILAVGGVTCISAGSL
jgi:drug/metabolite transporter (DMT)-like permease